tara:strand:+ start:540 stop:710 length:171 start_codon:yes stop_codon:yes gene_type:complete
MRNNEFISQEKREMLWGLERVLESKEALDHLPEGASQAISNAFDWIRKNPQDQEEN